MNNERENRRGAHHYVKGNLSAGVTVKILYETLLSWIELGHMEGRQLRNFAFKHDNDGLITMQLQWPPKECKSKKAVRNWLVGEKKFFSADARMQLMDKENLVVEVNGLKFGKFKEIPLAKQNWEIITGNISYYAFQDDFTQKPKDVERKRNYLGDSQLQFRETTISMNNGSVPSTEESNTDRREQTSDQENSLGLFKKHYDDIHGKKNHHKKICKEQEKRKSALFPLRRSSRLNPA